MVELEALQAWRASIQVPEHIRLTAELIWRRHGLEEEFLRTHCELTTYAIRDYLTPGRADDDELWKPELAPPEDKGRTFEVIFGDLSVEDHYMLIHRGVVYQSFAFVRELFATPYDPELPFCAYVPVRAALTEWRDKPLRFLVLEEIRESK